jgi:hypothetical protein
MPAGNPPLHRQLAMTASYCPDCGTRLAVDLHLVAETPVDDVDLDLSTL